MRPCYSARAAFWLPHDHTGASLASERMRPEYALPT